MPPPGALRQTNGSTRFSVWAPKPRSIELHVEGRGRIDTLTPSGNGYFEAVVDDLHPGTRYFYRLDGERDRPDPASRWQPDGVHRQSAVAGTNFPWTDGAWRGLPWEQFVLYEVHVGTFTREGTFDALLARLDALYELGVTAVELMPVAQYPGERNWGYDGVQPFAVQSSYGGPEALKRLVDACHARGMAVVLDVVYNHLGPEGNYLAEFGPYFTDRYHTPWGQAINFDGADSGPVRAYFLENIRYWLREFHVDAFRLDATHAIIDHSPRHFLAELADAVHEFGREMGRSTYAIAENNSNDPRLVLSASDGGYGLDAQLDDDFQRSLHALLAGEHDGYYADFGRLADFAKAYHAGFVLTGQHSKYRGTAWGQAAEGVPADRFVAYAQSHDTVGNRPCSERLGRLVDFESLKLAAAAVILGPAIPFLFMGEEYDELAPFNYFTSHLDRALGEAVRRGRIREFARFQWQVEPADPQRVKTFNASRLCHALADEGRHALLREYYRELLRLRREFPAVRQPDRQQSETICLEEQQVLISRRHRDGQTICVCMNFGERPARVNVTENHHQGSWQILLDSSSSRWQGPRETAAQWLPNQPLDVAARGCLLLLKD